MALLFLGVLLVSWGLGSLARRRAPATGIPAGAVVRLVGPGGVYRCHLLDEDRRGLTLSAPLQRDRYVPLRVGEELLAQTAGDGCLVTFRARVVGRDESNHRFRLARPERLRRVDRRCERRDRSVEGAAANVNGGAAKLLDLSANGARLVTRARVVAGDLVDVTLPAGLGEARGWALECRPDALGPYRAVNVRIRFEQSLSGLLTVRRRRSPGRSAGTL